MKICCLFFLIVMTLGVQAQVKVKELTEQDSFEINLIFQDVILEKNRPAQSIRHMSINACDVSPCLIAPGVSQRISVSNNIINTRCRIDAPEWGWQKVWSGTGTINFVTPVTYDDAILTVTCENQLFDQFSQSLVVQTNQESCSNSVYPPGLILISNEYATFNDGADFGTSINATFELTLNINEFAAVSGVSLPANFRRGFLLTSPPTQQQFEQLTFSVSTCPGDFTDNGTVCKRVLNNDSLIKFSTRPEDADSPFQYCMLEPDTQYYFNFITTPSPYTVAPSCQNGINSCTIYYQETFFNP
jgi:hypothetical protein